MKREEAELIRKRLFLKDGLLAKRPAGKAGEWQGWCGLAPSKNIMTMLDRRLLMVLVSAAHACAMSLQPASCTIDPQRCMGKWFVQRAIPAVKALEKNAHNGVELYEWDSENERVEVTYTFNAGSFEGPQRTVKQRGWVQDDPSGTRWAVAPRIAGFGLPVKLPFIIIDIDDTDYSFMTCTGGLNSWLYIMTRDMQPEPTTMQKLEDTVENLGFDMSKVISMPHQPSASA